MTTAQPGEYVLGTDTVELERLGIQHRLWGDAAHALWRAAGIRPGARVLDVGCGPGYASIDLAQLVGPAGRVVGVDESPGFVAELNRRAATLNLAHLAAFEGDVHDIAAALPPGDARFDAAFARWVFCFVKNPAGVVRSIADRLAPGARLAIFDYFNYAALTLAPREPVFDTLIDAIVRSWRDRGGDPDIVGRLPIMLAQAGLEVVHLGVHQRIARPGDPMWAWPTTFWASFLPRLVQTGHITTAQREQFDALWNRASADPTRFIALPPVWEIVAVKPA